MPSIWIYLLKMPVQEPVGSMLPFKNTLYASRSDTEDTDYNNAEHIWYCHLRHRRQYHKSARRLPTPARKACSLCLGTTDQDKTNKDTFMAKKLVKCHLSSRLIHFKMLTIYHKYNIIKTKGVSCGKIFVFTCCRLQCALGVLLLLSWPVCYTIIKLTLIGLKQQLVTS